MEPRLTRQLDLERPVRTPDGAGGFAENWETIGKLWAEVRSRSGREHAGESRTVSTMKYTVTVRSAPQGAPSRPKPEQRFRDGTRLFRIEAVADRDPSGRYLVCFVQEETPV